MTAIRRRGAFTLIELLVVVAIISLLLSMLLPGLRAARVQSRTVVCQANVRQMAVGWTLYVAEHKDTLPGSTNDYINRTTGKTPLNHPGYPVDYNKYQSFCWLGTIGETGDQTNDVPSQGTLFPYVGRMVDIYKCPEDKVDVIDKGPFGNFANETRYSYTAPSLLSGAKPQMLRSTLWAENFTSSQPWSNWTLNTRQSIPWILIEEHESEALAFVPDSAWGNLDTISDRHNGRGMIGHLDGHAGPIKFQREPAKLDAWRVYYGLEDGRVLSAGYWYDTQGKPIRYNYLRGRYVNGLVGP